MFDDMEPVGKDGDHYENENHYEQQEPTAEVLRIEALDIFDRATSTVRLLIENSTDNALLKFTVRFSKQMLTAARTISILKNWLVNAFFRPNLRRKKIGILPGGQKRRRQLFSGSSSAQQRGRPAKGAMKLQQQRGPKRRARVEWKE